ncbi:MAG TPA: DCC1-like thiol-disulfide oxidoreductase family protein [Kiritimatiellia bacterium]|nr:DCC1-like thiol-disulfide oxidoreductase family protein [Kiritimatiellia bacterium]
MTEIDNLVAFDGQCNLCQGAVRFIIKRDRQARFRFVSLQSDIGKRLLAGAGFPVETMDTIYLRDGGQWFDRSTAALRIARKLDGLWPLLYAFIIVPRALRDPIYRWIARNRLKWFGRTEACMLPVPGLESRFLSE